MLVFSKSKKLISVLANRFKISDLERLGVSPKKIMSLKAGLNTDPVSSRVKPRSRKSENEEGVKFDSQVERTVFNLCKTHKIPFDFQYEIEASEGFQYREDEDKTQRRIATWDFRFHISGIEILMDCKGQQYEFVRVGSERKRRKKRYEGFQYRAYLTKLFYSRSVEDWSKRPALYVMYKGEEMAWVMAVLKSIQINSIDPLKRWRI